MKTNMITRTLYSLLATCAAACWIVGLPLRTLGQGSANTLGAVSLQEEEVDKKQMLLIYEAIQAYRKKHGDLPKWLSDLVPEFLESHILVSPVERRTGQSRLLGYNDPKHQTSYVYEFSANQAGTTANRNREKPLTMKAWKQMQMEEFGPVTPLLRCHLYDPVLNLSYSGEFYETALFWETDPNTLALLKRLGPGPGPAKQRTVLTRVVDAGNGEPLAGVGITVSNRRSDLGALPPRTVTTDAEGRCRVPLGAGLVQSATLAFQKRDFAGGPVRWDTEDAIPAELTVRLKKAVTIGGFVRNSDNRPVQGVMVLISGVVEDEAGQVLLAEYDTVVTDQEGKWTSHSIPKDFKSLNLKLTHAEFLPTEYDQAESDQVGDREVSRSELVAARAILRILPGIGVEGIVLDPEKQPVSGAEVVLRDTTDTPKKRVQRTDSTGRFRFIVLETGLFQLWVQAAGWAPAFKAVEAEPGLKPLEFALSRGKTVRGQVLDAEGKPVAGAGVAVSAQGNQPLFSWGTETDSDGRFVWNSAPDGPVMLTATKAGLMPATQQVVPGSETEVKFRLTKTFMLTGKVVDADTKEPIKQFRIIRGSVWDMVNQESVNWEFHTEKAGYDGEYSANVDQDRGGPSMRVRFMIRAEGYLPIASPAFPTTGWHSFDFELKKGRGPEGVVKTSSGEPVAGAEVALLGAGYLTLSKAAFRNVGPANSFKTKTDALGRFALPAALASPKIAAVHEKGYAEVTAGVLAETGEICLEPWSQVEGVLKFGTRPGPDREIMLAPKETGPGSMQYDWETFRTKTDAEGRFVFSSVPPGQRQLVQLVPMGSGRGWMWSHQQAFEAKPGEVIKIIYGGTGRPVIGKLVLSDPNRNVDWNSGHHMFGTRYPRPPQGLRTREEIQVWQNSPEMKEARAKHRNYAFRVNEDGSFRLENILPGTYDLRIHLTESSSSSPGFGPAIGSVVKEVLVEEIPGGVTDEPLDIGELTIQVRPSAASTGARRVIQ